MNPASWSMSAFHSPPWRSAIRCAKSLAEASISLPEGNKPAAATGAAEKKNARRLMHSTTSTSFQSSDYFPYPEKQIKNLLARLSGSTRKFCSRPLGLVKAVLICAAILPSAPAGAFWQISEAKDRMTGKNESWAAVAAKAPDQGVTGHLEMVCHGGSRFYFVRLSAPMTRGRIAANLRSDDGPVRPTTGLQVFSDPHRISLLTTDPGRKRFRIELFPTGSPPLFFEFDLTGIEKAIAAVRCR